MRPEQGPTSSRRRLVAGLAATGLMAGCGVIPRPEARFGALPVHAGPIPIDRFRITSEDDARWLEWIRDWSAERKGLGLDGIRALALSGGGANGAYGAGVMVGWSERGDRPAFDLVTGVSTGALIAPFAFAGPDWNASLAEAYGDPEISALGRTDLGFLTGPSLRSGRPLRTIVRRHVDAALLRAIAARHRAGARLLVATTDLDGQRSVIWDVGTIAQQTEQSGDLAGGLALVRSVLVASSSVPGVLPPELILVDPASGAREMHVDGGVTVPFFFVPERMHFWRPEPAMRPLGLHLIINGQVGSRPQITRGAFPSILERSADTLGRSDARTQMRLAQAFATRNGASLAYAAIPDAVDANPLSFDVRRMEALFDLGRDRARQGAAFEAAQPFDGVDGT